MSGLTRGSLACGKSIERKASNLVRLALFTEYRRTLLKRDEIAKKGVWHLRMAVYAFTELGTRRSVLGGLTRKSDFQLVLDRAQQILRKTFAMELHEVMSRAEMDRADAARDGANVQDDETTLPGLKKRGVSFPTSSTTLSLSH